MSVRPAAVNRPAAAGPSTRASNIAACAALGSLVGVMLGPRGRHNLLLETEGGAQTVTNDGATLLSHLRCTTRPSSTLNRWPQGAPSSCPLSGHTIAVDG